MGAVIGTVVGTAVGGPIGGSIGAIAGGLLQSVLFPAGGGKQSMPKLSSYPLQSSHKGKPVPVVYGTRRIAGNIIWMGDLRTRTRTSGGGKGGGGPEVQTTIYRRSFLLALCEGPATVLRIWKGKKEISLTEGTVFDGVDNTGLAAILAAATGAPESMYDIEYKHTCCVLFENYKLGSTEMIPNFLFEVSTSVSFAELYLSGAWSPGPATMVALTGSGGYFGAWAPMASNSRGIAVNNEGNIWCTGGHAFGVSGGLYDKVTFDNIGWGPTGVSGRSINLGGDTIVSCGSFGAPAYQDGTAKACTLDTWSDADPPVLTERWTRQCVHVGGTQRYWCQPLTDGSVLVAGRNSFGPDPDWPAISYMDYDGNTVWEQSSPRAYCVVTNDAETIAYVACEFDGDFRTLEAWDMTPAAPPAGTLIQALNMGVDGNRLLWHDKKLYLTTDRTTYLGHTGSLWKFNGDLELLAYWDPGASQPDLLPVRPDRFGNIMVLENVGGAGYTAVDGRDWHVMLLNPEHTPGVVNVLEEVGSFRIPFADIVTENTYFPDDIASVPPGWDYDHADVNPADINQDILMDSRYGAGIPEAYVNLDTFDSVRQYCFEQNIGISIVLDSQQPVMDVIDYVNSHFNGYLYVSEGKVCLGVFRDEEPVDSITADDLVTEGDTPPVSVTKRSPREIVNRVEVTWTDRANLYQPEVAIANEELHQELTDTLRIRSITLDGICRNAYADTTAYRMLFEGLYRYSTYRFRLGYKKMLLQVGNVITVTDGYLLDAVRMRILSITESKDGRNLDIEAIEDPAYMYDNVIATVASSEHTPDPPADVQDAVVNLVEDVNNAQILINIAPGSEDVTGYYIYKSYDDATFAYLGEVTTDIPTGESGAQGTITTDMQAYHNVIARLDDKVRVNVGEDVTLLSVGDTPFFANKQLAIIEDEVIAYRDVTAIGSGVWELSGLIRGLYNTEPVAHAATATFHTVDAIYADQLLPEDAGKTIYYKVVAFYGTVVQELADVSSTSIVVSNDVARPAPSTLIRIDSNEGLWDYAGATVTLDWNLASKELGFNLGPFNWDNSTLTTWPAAAPPYNDGIEYGEYIANPDMEAVILRIETTVGVLVNELELGATIETYELTFADAAELDSTDPAVIKIIPKTSLRDLRENQVTIDRL